MTFARSHGTRLPSFLITVSLTWWFINWVDELVRPIIPAAFRTAGNWLPSSLNSVSSAICGTAPDLHAIALLAAAPIPEQLRGRGANSESGNAGKNQRQQSIYSPHW